MPGNNNEFSYEWDPRSMRQAIASVNKDLKDLAATGNVTGDTLAKVFSSVTHLSEMSVVSIDKQARAQDRMVKSVIAQNDAYGKSAIDREIQKRDRIIKQLGDNEKAVKSVTASYDALLKKMKDADAHGSSGGGHGGPLSGAGRFAFLGAKDLLEGRVTNAIAEGTNVLTKLGGTALAVGSVAAAIGGVGFAALEARKMLAEYGNEIRDIGLRTGLTTREVATFSFAAKAQGTDISVVDRLMRGLTTATEDYSPAGEKARKTLDSLGVSVTDLNGNVRPTADLLLQISDGMAKAAPGTKLAADAMALFKRVGVEAIPFLKELRENTNFAREHGLPTPTDEEITRWDGYNRQLALMDSYLGSLKRGLAEQIVVKVEFLTSVVGAGAALIEKIFPRQGFGPNKDATVVAGPRGGGIGPDRYLTTEQAAEEAKQDRAIAEMNAQGGLMAATVASRRAGSFLGTLSGTNAEQAERKLASLKSALDEQVEQMRTIARAGTVLPKIERDHEKAILDANSAYQEQLVTVNSLRTAESERISNAEALRRLVATTNDLMTEGPYISKADRTLLEFSRRSGVTDEQVSAAEKALRPEAQLEAEQGIAKARAAGRLEIEKTVKAIKDESHTYDDRAFTSSLQQQSVLIKENLAIYTAGLKEINKSELDAAESGVRLASALAPDSLANRRSSETQLAAIRIASVNEVARQDKEDARIKYIDGVDKLTAIRNIEIRNEREVAAIRSELQEQNAKEYREQLDSIKKETQSLLMTAFSSPSKFLSQLGTTVRTAVLKPITEGLSERIAVGLQPLIFGRNGTTGIAGGLRSLVGGGTSGLGAPLMPAASALTYAAGALTSAASTLSVGGGGGGFAMPSVGGTSGQGLGGGFNVGGLLGSLGLGPGGTSGFSGPVSMGGGGGGGGGFGGFNLGGIFGGGGGGFGKGLGGINLSALKGSFFNQSLYTGFGHATAASSLGPLGSLAGILTSPMGGNLMIAGGLPLLMRGLGQNRGTGKGILQGTLGGALTGAGIGTMILPGIGTAIGAGIGAAAGLLTGLIQKWTGAQSPQNEVRKLVKQTYGITINNQQTEGIIQLAKQNYFGNYAVAVRSPEVRQALGLYAAGTGQAGQFTQAVGIPHGGGLAMSGGSLFQTPSFQYGNPYASSSSLPVLGGSAFSLPSPGGGGGGPVMLSVNVEGAGIAPFFSGQVVNADYVQARQSQAWRGSNGRVSSSLDLAQPGSIAG